MKKYIISYLVLLNLTLTTSAQIQLPEVLQTPIEQAILRSKEIQNKQLELEKSELERKSVLSKHIPRVDATAGYAYLDNHIIVDVPGYKLPITGYEIFSGKTRIENQANAVHGGVIAKSVLYSGGQIQNGAAALKQKAIGDSFLIETDKDNVVLDVISSFDKLRFIAVSELLIKDSDTRLQKEEERVTKAIQNGLAVPFDRDKIKLARLELESKQTELEENKNLLLQKLNYLTGMPIREIENISYDLLPIVLSDGLTADNKQELDALKSYKSASELVLKKEKGTFLPQVAAFAGVSYTSLFDGASSFKIPNVPAPIANPNLQLNQFTVAPNWMAGVVLKWEIFGGTERKHKVKEAQISVQQLENKLEDSKEKLNLLLAQKMASVQTQSKQMVLADQKEVVAKNTLTLASRQYTQGLISISQRLEAENDFLKAGQNKTEVLINQRQASLEAMMVTGRLTEKIQYN